MLGWCGVVASALITTDNIKVEDTDNRILNIHRYQIQISHSHENISVWPIIVNN